MDIDIYGYTAVTIGDATLKVRRVLSRGQEHAVSNAQNAASSSQMKLQTLSTQASVALNALEEGDTAGRERIEKQFLNELEAAQNILRFDIIQGITAMTVNADEFDFDDWALSSLSTLYVKLQEHVAKSLNSALEAAFP